jgi:alanine dehydrogenase
MPGAYARTSTIALSNSTYSYIRKMANLGYRRALAEDRHLLNGLNVYKGHITCRAVAESQNRRSDDAMELLHVN